MNFWSCIALAYPLGLAPKAPGTAGSLLGIPVGYAFFFAAESSSAAFSVPAFLIKVLLLLILGVFAFVAIDRTEKLWQTHDESCIVIDEVLGQAIPISFLSPGLWNFLAAFALFRLFDIIKPGPIGWADRKLPGAVGTLLDDVIAGIFTYLTLCVINLII